MKKLVKILSLVMVFVVVGIMLVACGSGNSESTETTQATEITETETVQVTETQAFPAADPNAGDDTILGNWVQVDDSTRYAKITKTDNTYQYVDNDGTYVGEFKNGVLTVKVTEAENDTADIYLDPVSKNLYSVYGGAASIFKKEN